MATTERPTCSAAPEISFDKVSHKDEDAMFPFQSVTELCPLQVQHEGIGKDAHQPNGQVDYVQLFHFASLATSARPLQ